MSPSRTQNNEIQKKKKKVYLHYVLSCRASPLFTCWLHHQELKFESHSMKTTNHIRGFQFFYFLLSGIKCLGIWTSVLNFMPLFFSLCNSYLDLEYLKRWSYLILFTGRFIAAEKLLYCIWWGLGWLKSRYLQ